MYEELLQPEEEKASGFPGILIGKAHPVSAGEIKGRIEYIRRMAEEDPGHIKEHMGAVVPTYHRAAYEDAETGEMRGKLPEPAEAAQAGAAAPVRVGA